MPNPLILYSTNTRLAHWIAQKFYGAEHYVWCTPCFDADSLPSLSRTTPPSSCPKDIYRELSRAVAGTDRHSSKIADNKVGIRKGAVVKHAAGVITASQMDEINAVVELAEIAQFKPLLYVIPYSAVSGLITAVPVANRANPLSEEYIIERLPEVLFDVLEIAGC